MAKDVKVDWEFTQGNGGVPEKFEVRFKNTALAGSEEADGFTDGSSHDVGNVNDRTWTHSADTGHTWHYCVRAVNAAGASDFGLIKNETAKRVKSVAVS